MTHILGGACVLAESFRPESFLEAVERHRVTTTAVVPTMLHRLMQMDTKDFARFDARSLTMILTTGAPLSAELSNAVMDRFGDVLFNLYGSTETAMVPLAKPADLRSAPGTIGRA